jgi:hypothetical protein
MLLPRICAVPDKRPLKDESPVTAPRIYDDLPLNYYSHEKEEENSSNNQKAHQKLQLMH